MGDALLQVADVATLDRMFPCEAAANGEMANPRNPEVGEKVTRLRVAEL
ncbi:MAG: hypothetical protein U0792_11155 [Gemmataceae bacterium]